MSKIIAVHSYKGGTGKTSMSINLAATFAKQGKKVALLDVDFRAPSLFAVLKCEKTPIWLNDYLNGKCEVDKTLIDLSARLDETDKFCAGLANPSTAAMRDMTTKDRRWEMRALGRLLDLRKKLFTEQNFDYIIFDTSPGLQYSSLNAIVTADFVVVTTTCDCSDVNGTKRMLADFYKMFEKKTGLVFNKVAGSQKSKNAELFKKVQETYKVPLIGVIPCLCEVVEAEGQCIFPQDRPNHPFTSIIAEIASKIEKS